MAHFQGRRPSNEPSAWMPASGYVPVVHPERGAHISPSRAGQALRPRHVQEFKPFAHRTISFALLAVIVLGLVGALEYGIHVLPQVPFDPQTLVIKVPLHRRQDDPITPTESPASPTAAVSTVTELTSIDAYMGAAATTGTVSPSVSTTDPSDYLGGSATTFASPGGDPDPVETTISEPSSTSMGGTIFAPVSPSTTTSIAVSIAAPTSQSYMKSSGATGTESSSSPPSSPTGSNGQQEAILQSAIPLTLVDHPQNYFLGAYMPVVVAVLLRLLAGYLYRCTKLLDPFFALSRPEGAMFKDFFWADHLGPESLMAPFRAFRSRSWPLFWTAVLYAAAQLLTPFASELTSIHKSNYSYEVADGGRFVRGNAVWVNPIIVRILQGLLGFIFVQLLSVWILLRWNKSSLCASPASIATIASIVSHPETAEDFTRADQYAKKKVTTKLFANRRYRLDWYSASDSNELYGIVPVDSTFDPAFGSRILAHSGLPPTSPHHTPIPFDPRRSSNTGPQPPRRKGVVNLLLVTATAMALLGVVLAYAINSAPTSFEHFMDSQSFGPRFLLSILGLIVKSPLLALCARTTASVPFSRLAAHPRRANLDILTPVPVTPLGSIGYALRRCEWFAASLAIAAGVLVEFLLILLPGVPFEAKEYWQAGEASWYGSIGCLGFILLVAIVGWIRLFGKQAGWPKSPTTVGAVAMYVAGTGMAADCAATGTVIDGKEVRYEFGMREGRWVVEYADDVHNQWYAQRDTGAGVFDRGDRAGWQRESASSPGKWSRSEIYSSGEWRQESNVVTEYGGSEGWPGGRVYSIR